jgi:hypothetical protein
MLTLTRNTASLTVTFPDGIRAQYWGRPHATLSKAQIVGKLVDALVRAKVAEEVEKPAREKKKKAAVTGKQPMTAKTGAKPALKKSAAKAPAKKGAKAPVKKDGEKRPAAKAPMPTGDTGIHADAAA